MKRLWPRANIIAKAIAFFIKWCSALQELHSFPTRRSSDLGTVDQEDVVALLQRTAGCGRFRRRCGLGGGCFGLRGWHGTNVVGRARDGNGCARERWTAGDIVCALTVVVPANAGTHTL